MLRDKSLVPLSRQHQHALALCVRIDRASPIAESDLSAWQIEIGQHFQAEIRVHFVAEEQFIFPDELLSDHAWLRERFAQAEAQRLSGSEITEFARRLSKHIRREERQLFERLQELTSSEELALMGQKVELALQKAGQVCITRKFWTQ